MDCLTLGLYKFTVAYRNYIFDEVIIELLPTRCRYIQVGNAVAVPVARALGYALGRAFQGLAGDDPVFNLPKKFPRITEDPSSSSEAQC